MNEDTGDTGVTETTESTDVTETTGTEKPKLEISAADLGLGGDEPTEESEVVEEAEVVEKEVPVVGQEAAVRNPPKSWPKEMHEHWSKTDPKVQEYWETREKQMLDGLDQYKDNAGFGKTLRDIMSPYRPLLQSQGVDEPQAVQFLLNAHYKLTNSPPSEKQAFFQKLAKDYGIDIGTQREESQELTELREQVSQLRTGFQTREQREVEQYRNKTAAEVNNFATEADKEGKPLRPYFDEVADDIVAYINAGKSLDEAYERAVRANPVTYQKEQVRLQTENEAKLKEKIRLEALKAKTASSTNVKGRDTRRTPTEPKGTMEDTMKEKLREIRSRTH